MNMKKLHAVKAKWKRRYLAQRMKGENAVITDMLSVGWNMERDHLSKIERFRLRALVNNQRKK